MSPSLHLVSIMAVSNSGSTKGQHWPTGFPGQVDSYLYLCHCGTAQRQVEEDQEYGEQWCDVWRHGEWAGTKIVTLCGGLRL